MLEKLFVSKVRIKILNLFFSNYGKRFYVREITRSIKEEINAVRRELENLVGIGLLYSEPRANRLYYSLKEDFFLLPELFRMIVKSYGLGGRLLKNRNKLGKIKYALLSIAFLKGRVAVPSEVDLTLIGKISLPQLNSFIREEEKAYGHEINYTVMTEEEFNFRKKRRDPFVIDILMDSKVVLIGSEEELVKLS